jgi:kynureninase
MTSQMSVTTIHLGAGLDSRAGCEAADALDELAVFRGEFDIPENLIYMDGNSLGPLPRAAPRRASEVVRQEWGAELIGSWNSRGWFELPTVLGDKLAHLIGARAGEVVVTDSTSVNIFKALTGSIAIQAHDHPDRRVIVMESDDFPTDRYIATGITKFIQRGYQIRTVDDPSRLAESLGGDVVAVLL